MINGDLMTFDCECRSCGATGLYCGFAEPRGVAVVCLECNGRGGIEYTFEWKREDIYATRFKSRKPRTGIHTVRRSAGSFLATGVGPTGGSVTYEEFCAGKMP